MSIIDEDEALWQVRRWLMHKYGSFAADRYISPLIWYVRSGRASLSFLRKFCVAKPFVIGRQLVAGGSDDEIIARVKRKLGV